MLFHNLKFIKCTLLFLCSTRKALRLGIDNIISDEDIKVSTVKLQLRFFLVCISGIVTDFCSNRLYIKLFKTKTSNPLGFTSGNIQRYH